MAKRRRKLGITLMQGELVLVSFGRASMPRDWLVCRVLWADGKDVLLDRAGAGGGDDYRQVLSIDAVRAVGPYPALREFQERCAAETARRWKAVHALERRLGDARDAVWRKLDAIGCGGPLRLDLEETG